MELNATTLTKNQCKDIMAPALITGLNGMGICQHLPRQLVHGPLELQGIGIPHLYTLQCIVHMEDLILHTAKNTLTGKLLRANLKQVIIDVGVSPEVLNTNYDIYGCLTPYTLIASLWEFLHNADIHLKHDIQMPTRQTNDQYLMTIFGQLALTAKQLQAINWCQLLLQVNTVADIATADRQRITEQTLLGV